MDPASPMEALEAELRASQAECRALKRTADELRVQHFEAFSDLNAQLEKAHAELDRTRQLLVVEQRQTRLVEDEAKHAAEQYRQWAEESNARAKESEQLLQALRADVAHKTSLLSAARARVRPSRARALTSNLRKTSTKRSSRRRWPWRSQPSWRWRRSRRGPRLRSS